ncbi:MAG: hypothetical protein QXI11_03110 [Thermoproteota archaeon]
MVAALIVGVVLLITNLIPSPFPPKLTSVRQIISLDSLMSFDPQCGLLKIWAREDFSSISEHGSEYIKIYGEGVANRSFTITLHLPNGAKKNLGRKHFNTELMLGDIGFGYGLGKFEEESTGYWGEDYWSITASQLKELLEGFKTATITFDASIKIDAKYVILYGSLIETGDINFITKEKLATLEIQYEDKDLKNVIWRPSKISIAILNYRKPAEGRDASDLIRKLNEGLERSKKESELTKLLRENFTRIFGLEYISLFGYSSDSPPDYLQRFRIGDKVVAIRDLGEITIEGKYENGSFFKWKGPAIPKGSNGYVIDVKNYTSNKWYYYVSFEVLFEDHEKIHLTHIAGNNDIELQEQR